MEKPFISSSRPGCPGMLGLPSLIKSGDFPPAGGFKNERLRGRSERSEMTGTIFSFFPYTKLSLFNFQSHFLR
ncbi:hypothetical protein BH23BAC3_BH23BAC3_31790 [soil metagenome]